MKGSSRDKSLARLEQLGKFLDTAIPVGNSGYKIGMDPLIGLVPGIGDSISAFIGAYIIIEAARLGASRLTLAKMMLNLGFDTIVGVVPLIGDYFDFTFKANVKNIDLVKEAKLSHERSPEKKLASAFLLTLLGLIVILSLIFTAAIFLAVKIAGQFLG